MGIEKYDIIDRSYSNANSSSYNLSILVGLDRFIYSITDAENNLLVLKSKLFESKDNYIEQKKNIKQTIEEDERLTLIYAKVVVAQFDKNTTLVPTDYFDEKNLEGYFRTVLYGNNPSLIQADSIPELKTHHVYELNKEIVNHLLTYYPQATLIHLNTALLNYLSQLNGSKGGTNIFINTIAYTMSVFVFTDGELIMVNSYEFKSTKDYLYFVMLIFNQLGLEKSTTTIHLGGEMAKSSQIVSLLGKYYSKIEFMDRPVYMKWPNQFLNTPDHYFIDLFSLTLCE